MPKFDTHDKISFVKSGIRIAGYGALIWSVFWGALLLVVAEVLGIGEELFDD